MTDRDSIVEAALGWLQTPFHHEARVKGVGVDCLQLIIAAHLEAGLLPANIDDSLDHYPHDAHLHNSDEQYIAGLLGHGWSEVEAPLKGDVAMFKIGRRYSHGVIVTDWPNAIHAYVGRRVGCVDCLNDAELSNRPVRFFSKVNV